MTGAMLVDVALAMAVAILVSYVGPGRWRRRCSVSSPDLAFFIANALKI